MQQTIHQTLAVIKKLKLKFKYENIKNSIRLDTKH
jgi:hypothetical protein